MPFPPVDLDFLRADIWFDLWPEFLAGRCFLLALAPGPPLPDAAPLRILLLEDVSMDAELLEYELQRARIVFTARRVDSRDTFLEALAAFKPDLILADYTLPGFDGMTALGLAKEAAPVTPFIVVTGSINEETAVGCMRAGASDYLLKNNLARIGPAIEAALERERARAERRTAEAALRQSEANLRATFHNAVQDFVLLDRRGRVLTLNKAASNWANWVTGRDVSEGDILVELLPPGVAEEWTGFFAEALAGRMVTIERQVTNPAGADRWFEAHLIPVVAEDGGVIGVCLSVVNIDERKRTEENLRRVERLQAIGRLAGGVAHEVNNMMTVVLGLSEFLLRDLPTGDRRHEDVVEISRAADRAANITRQLLAFSRQQVMQPRLLDLNAVVQGTQGMLSRLLGAAYTVRLDLEPLLSSVRADPTQLEQVLLNLVLNARDAMPSGGAITVETHSAMLDDAYMQRHPGVDIPHGSYSAIIVSDRGCGMEHDVQLRVFEPFFTTKPLGEGTGLGLSTAYGIVKQTGGYIWVYSEPGLGSTFKVYLPAFMAAPTAPRDLVRQMPSGGRETLLVVEDEEMVRLLACRVLRERGYTVHEASHGAEALELLERTPLLPDLVVSDVVMPTMGGRELGSRLRERSPELPVLYMSGFTGEDVVRRGLLEPGVPFQQKPFHPDALAKQVRDLLDARRVPSTLDS
jgi:two-component system, cell cycle sensor histidine kinase and response regulator CckA